MNDGLGVIIGSIGVLVGAASMSNVIVVVFVDISTNVSVTIFVLIRMNVVKFSLSAEMMLGLKVSVLVNVYTNVSNIFVNVDLAVSEGL